MLLSSSFRNYISYAPRLLVLYVFVSRFRGNKERAKIILVFSAVEFATRIERGKKNKTSSSVNLCLSTRGI